MSDQQPNPYGGQNVPPQGQQPVYPPQPQGYYPGYGQPQVGYRQPYTPKTNTMAILAIVFGFVFSPLGIVFGHIGLSQIKRTGEQGRGLALTGLIVGYVFTALWVLYIILIIVAIAVAGSALGGYYS